MAKKDCSVSSRYCTTESSFLFQEIEEEFYWEISIFRKVVQKKPVEMKTLWIVCLNSIIMNGLSMIELNWLLVIDQKIVKNLVFPLLLPLENER